LNLKINLTQDGSGIAILQINNSWLSKLWLKTILPKINHQKATNKQ
jgi:hypothetical protein